MDTALNKIKLIVKNKIGLDSSTIGDSTIEKIILQRIQQSNAADFKDYLQLINTNPQELNELLETAVIPETWFFRDIKPFEFIYKNILKKYMENQSSTFRILSIPSSTGEEPYSLAMYLIDKGISDSIFNIDAVDVSPRALELAKTGVYGNNSFRGKHYSSYQIKHFSCNNNTYNINQNIKDKIKFYNLNILHEQDPINDQFDFILCRNLLIYFDTDTKLIAFDNLSKLMKDNAYLFIGHSEFGAVPDELFKNTGFEKAFALIKHTHPEFTESHKNSTKKTNSKKIKPPYIKPNFKKLINTPEETTNNAPTIKQIKQLSDASNFEEAKEICQLYINSHGEDSDVLYFLGLINSSKDNHDKAEKHFRKSLFLNPKHYNSLIHLSLILDRKGDSKNSALLKKRAENTLIEQDNAKT